MKNAEQFRNQLMREFWEAAALKVKGPSARFAAEYADQLLTEWAKRFKTAEDIANLEGAPQE